MANSGSGSSGGGGASGGAGSGGSGAGGGGRHRALPDTGRHHAAQANNNYTGRHRASENRGNTSGNQGGKHRKPVGLEAGQSNPNQKMHLWVKGVSASVNVTNSPDNKMRVVGGKGIVTGNMRAPWMAELSQDDQAAQRIQAARQRQKGLMRTIWQELKDAWKQPGLAAYAPSAGMAWSARSGWQPYQPMMVPNNAAYQEAQRTAAYFRQQEQRMGWGRSSNTTVNVQGPNYGPIAVGAGAVAVGVGGVVGEGMGAAVASQVMEQLNIQSVNGGSIQRTGNDMSAAYIHNNGTPDADNIVATGTVNTPTGVEQLYATPETRVEMGVRVGDQFVATDQLGFGQDGSMVMESAGVPGQFGIDGSGQSFCDMGPEFNAAMSQFGNGTSAGQETGRGAPEGGLAGGGGGGSDAGLAGGGAGGSDAGLSGSGGGGAGNFDGVTVFGQNNSVTVDGHNFGVISAGNGSVNINNGVITGNVSVGSDGSVNINGGVNTFGGQVNSVTVGGDSFGPIAAGSGATASMSGGVSSASIDGIGSSGFDFSNVTFNGGIQTFGDNMTVTQNNVNGQTVSQSITAGGSVFVGGDVNGANITADSVTFGGDVQNATVNANQINFAGNGSQNIEGNTFNGPVNADMASGDSLSMSGNDFNDSVNIQANGAEVNLGENNFSGPVTVEGANGPVVEVQMPTDSVVTADRCSGGVQVDSAAGVNARDTNVSVGQLTDPSFQSTVEQTGGQSYSVADGVGSAHVKSNGSTQLPGSMEVSHAQGTGSLGVGQAQVPMQAPSMGGAGGGITQNLPSGGPG